VNARGSEHLHADPPSLSFSTRNQEIDMNAKPSLTVAALVWGIGIATGVAGGLAVAGVQRMRTHQPDAPAASTAVQVDAGPQLDTIVVPLRDGVRRGARQPDAVADSFDRMLSHTPNRVAPPVPSGLGTDPLAAAMVEPLRERQGAATVQQASAAPPTRKQ
jgi:hypothetical protein